MLRGCRLASGLVLLVILAGTACGGGKSSAKTQPTAAVTTTGAGATANTSPTPPPPADTAGALSAFVQQQLGKSYAGDCGQPNLQNDPAKVCSIAKGQRENLSAFQLQPVGAKPTNWVIFQSQGTSVTVANSLTITPDTSVVPGVPWPLRTGVELVVAGSDPCVNVREGPSLGQKAVDCIKDGTKLRLVAGPSASDNIQWWQVEGRTGWVAGDYLRYPDAAQ